MERAILDATAPHPPQSGAMRIATLGACRACSSTCTSNGGRRGWGGGGVEGHMAVAVSRCRLFDCWWLSTTHRGRDGSRASSASTSRFSTGGAFSLSASRHSNGGVITWARSCRLVETEHEIARKITWARSRRLVAQELRSIRIVTCESIMSGIYPSWVYTPTGYLPLQPSWVYIYPLWVYTRTQSVLIVICCIRHPLRFWQIRTLGFNYPPPPPRSY